ncbi:MAG TPA: hypothetical protein PK425_03170 [Syntrophales bacterium]|nr:hypothetical protein [Syntrophales bacterium]
MLEETGKTGMDDIRIEKIDPAACYDKLYEFLQKVWPGAWSTDKKLFYWRTILSAQSPSTKTAVYAAMDRDSNIRGVLCGIPGGVSIDGRQVAITWAVDFTVEEKLRRKGIGTRLNLSLCENEPNFVALGGTAMSLSNCRSLGWVIRDNVKSYIKVLKPIRYLLHKKNKNRDHLKIMFRATGALLGETLRRVEAEGIRKVEGDCFSPAEILEKNSPSDFAVTLRPKDLIMWQCENAPFPKSDYFIMENKGCGDGYMILRTHETKEGFLEGRILDIFSRDLNKQDLKLMIAYAVMAFRKKNAVQVRLIASHPSLKMACLELDFHERQGPFLIHPPDLPDGMDQAEWHLTMLDSDFAYR